MKLIPANPRGCTHTHTNTFTNMAKKLPLIRWGLFALWKKRV